MHVLLFTVYNTNYNVLKTISVYNNLHVPLHSISRVKIDQIDNSISL